MATYYGVKGSSNWNSGNWSTTATKDATRTGSGVTPTASDDCILDDWSSDGGGVTWTINATTCVCKTLNCTGYAGVLAFATGRLSASGSVTFDNTHTITSTGTAGELRFSAAGTLTLDGLTFPGSIVYSTGGTFPLAGTTDITGTLTLGGSVAFSGAYDITCGTLVLSSVGTTSKIVAGRTLNVLTAINASVNGFGTVTLSSGTASSEAFLHFSGAAADCKIAGITFLDINCAHPINNWYGVNNGTPPTPLRCTGITNRTSADFATAAQAAKILDDTTISGVTGTIATLTISAANDTIAAGYYAATTLSARDTDLAVGNIVVTI